MVGVMNQLLSHLKLRQDWYSFQLKIQGLTFCLVWGAKVSPRSGLILCIYLFVCYISYTFSHILHIVCIYVWIFYMQRRSLHVWHVLPLMTLCRIPSFQDETPMSISHAPMEGLNLNLHSVRCPSQIFSSQNDGWWWSFLYSSRLSRLVKKIIRLVNETTKKNSNIVESFGKTSRDIPQNIFAV